MNGKIINFQEQTQNWRERYHYALYNHRLISSNGVMYSRPFIVVKNNYNVIVRFTNLHNYAGIYEKKVFVPITSDAETKLHYICKMLNYVLIQHYDRFRINHVFKVSREALECFFRDYAMEKLPNGEYRGEQSVENCTHAVTSFFQKLHRKFGDYLLLRNEDLFTETIVYEKHTKKRIKNIPAFQVRGIPKINEPFRELPTAPFRILLNLAFRYAPDIAFAICLQTFAGLRAGEVCNVRQEGTPAGNGLVFTKIDNRTRKIEIDLRRELVMRSDGVVCGKIKKERIQCVYPPFMEAFTAAYEHHKRFLAGRLYESEYSPMFINSRGMAMTYDNYARRFKKLVQNHFRAALLECDDPECRIYGQLLYENDLTTHALRHWFSVQLTLRGEDIAQIQFWRGDKNPESAFAYLQNKGDLVRELESANEFLAEILMQEGGRRFDE